jgi:FMN phosphatase YigB (HAD superfamily)
VGSVLDRYDAVLLDMNCTFMFGEDRFGPAHDYYPTYRALGGERLSADELRRAVEDCYAEMAALYEDPAHVDDFPQVREVLAGSAACTGLAASEVELVEGVIARHELGHVPAEYAGALRRLAATHRLGLVANIWSRKGPWLDELRRAGVLDLFSAIVFSSDGPHMKPSPVLFRQALAAIAVPSSATVFVGDNLWCDIGGATAAGLDSVWLNPHGVARPAGSPAPTYEVRSLLDLAEPVSGPASLARQDRS